MELKRPAVKLAGLIFCAIFISLDKPLMVSAYNKR
jgi:hypothetical protein